MKAAFIIWTPLHLYNALRFIISNDMIGECDAYYISQSAGMEKYYHGALSEGVFRNIYYSTSEKLKKNQHLWEVTNGLFFPSIYVRYMFGREAADNYYDQIFMSVPTRLNDAIIRANDCREVVGYDDGTGSYIGNLYDRSLGKKYELIRKTIKKSHYRVSKTYINNPEIVIPRERLLYEKLLARELSEAEEIKIKKIFGFEHKDRMTSFVYLNQPINEIAITQDNIKIEEKIIEALSDELGNNISVRIHPREKAENLFKGMTIQDSSQMWELLCNEEDLNNNVLISFFSTAQFTPKLLFNKEPFIIFTLNLYGDYPKDRIDSYMSLIKTLKDIYTKKERIIIPSTFGSLMAAIEEIKGIVL